MPIKKTKVRMTACCMMLLYMATAWQGCVRDDLSDCGIGVQFRYIKNVDAVDKFSTAVEDISLFVFDQDGKFIGRFDESVDALENNQVMTLPLKAGKYKMFAWGNLDECYNTTDCQESQTQMEEFMLKLNRSNDIVTEHPTHLYYGGILEVEVEKTTGRKTVLMDMMKDTNTIYVTAKGLPTGDGTQTRSGTAFSCSITSRNGDYHYDNSITGNRMTYIPKYTVGEAQLKSDFVVMRELNDGSTGSRLVITHDTSGNELFNEDLTQLLLPAAITGDLDIDDVFDIEVEFDHTNGSFTVTVNDFVVIENGGGSIFG